MNKEEAKIRFEEIETYAHGFYDDVLIKKRDAKVLLDQLNQPKPVVPQFIADYIESCIKAGSGLIWSIRPDRNANELCRLTYDWLFPNGYILEDGSFPYPFEPDNLVRPDSNNQLKFARAWIAYPNIKVQKEKLYTVEILDKTLVKVIKEDGIYFYKMTSYFLDINKQQMLKNLTELEIKEADERLWQFAKEVANED